MSQSLQLCLPVLHARKPASPGHWPAMQISPGPPTSPCGAEEPAPQGIILESSVKVQPKDCRRLCLFPSASTQAAKPYWE